MTNIVAYALPLNPEPWAIGEAYVIRTGKNNKLIAKVGPNKTTQAYQNAIKDELLLQKAGMVPGKYALRIHFARQLYSYTRSEDGGTSTRNVVDATNVQKATEDAIQGVLIGNDRDVLRVETVNVEQSADADPFILIELKWGLTEDDFTHWDSHLMTIQGECAMEKMYEMERTRKETKTNGNVWTP